MRKVRRGERRTRAGARSYLAILLLFKELDHPLGLVLEEVANQRERGIRLTIALAQDGGRRLTQVWRGAE
jgi:hypothetical protein